MVELTLFSQVTANFNQYLTLMSSMEDLDALIDNGLQKIRITREAINKTHRLFLTKGRKIQSLLRRKEAIERTIEKAGITRKLGGISDHLKTTMNKGIWDEEVFQEINSSQKQWDSVKGVVALSRFGSEIERMKS